MALAYLKVRLLAAIFATILASACGPVSQNPAMIANLSNESARTSTSSTLAADINRNIAAAAMSFNASSDYRVGPEDLLEITLFNVPGGQGMEQQVTPRTVTVRVTHQGQISLPLIGELDVKGLTVPGLEKRLREAYDKYIYNPQVGVLIREFRQRASVIGAVLRPGVFELTGPKSVIELLAMAGGVSEKAGNQVHIYRQAANGRETHVIDLIVLANSTGLVNASNAAMINMPVEPGDMINVPEAGMFFIEGAVRRPGSYPLGRRYSLNLALATAGGVDPELNSNDISILRRLGPGEVRTIAFNLTEVMSGTVADPEIRPDDVIVVPMNTAKYFVRRFVGTLIGGMSFGSIQGYTR
jgi:polysaccharide biosynthesis/export protein